MKSLWTIHLLPTKLKCALELALCISSKQPKTCQIVVHNCNNSRRQQHWTLHIPKVPLNCSTVDQASLAGRDSHTHSTFNTVFLLEDKCQNQLNASATLCLSLAWTEFDLFIPSMVFTWREKNVSLEIVWSLKGAEGNLVYLSLSCIEVTLSPTKGIKIHSYKFTFLFITASFWNLDFEAAFYSG